MGIKLKSFLSLYEQTNKVNDIISFIVNNYPQGRVDNLVAAKIPEHVKPGWEEKYDTEEEWYEKHGQGEAEYAVITDIIQQVARRKNINLSQTEFADLQNWFYNKYDL